MNVGKRPSGYADLHAGLKRDPVGRISEAPSDLTVQGRLIPDSFQVRYAGWRPDGPYPTYLSLKFYLP